MKMPSGTITNTALRDALLVAEQIDGQPDVGLSAVEARMHIKALAAAINRSACFRNASLKGRETFCFSSEDRLAPASIRVWGANAVAVGAQEKGVDAVAIAERWEKLDYARMPT